MAVCQNIDSMARTDDRCTFPEPLTRSPNTHTHIDRCCDPTDLSISPCSTATTEATCDAMMTNGDRDAALADVTATGAEVGRCERERGGYAPWVRPRRTTLTRRAPPSLSRRPPPGRAAAPRGREPRRRDAHAARRRRPAARARRGAAHRRARSLARRSAARQLHLSGSEIRSWGDPSYLYGPRRSAARRPTTVTRRGREHNRSLRAVRCRLTRRVATSRVAISARRAARRPARRRGSRHHDTSNSWRGASGVAAVVERRRRRAGPLRHESECGGRTRDEWTVSNDRPAPTRCCCAAGRLWDDDGVARERISRLDHHA